MPTKPKTTSLLIIEPHPFMRASLLAAIASDLDLEVVQPGTPEDNSLALKLTGGQVYYLPREKPGIVILALGNPGREEIQALKMIHQQWPEMALLVLTSSEVPGQEQEAIACGAKVVLPKTVSRTELLTALHWLKSNLISYN
jgi:DNA-binding NarL/FixJ family response regulator